MPKKDFTQTAFSVVQQATGEEPKLPEKTPRQVAGRKGGEKGGVARASKLTPEQRSEIARLASDARWKKST